MPSQDVELIKIVSYYLFFKSPWQFRVFAWAFTILVWSGFILGLAVALDKL